MGKKILPAVYDAQLSFLVNNANRLFVCTAEPTTYEEASATYALAGATLAPANFAGPADGSVSGRKISLLPVENIPIDVGGSATHIVLADATNSRILLVTVCTAQTLVAGNNVTVDSFDYTLPQPAA